MTAGESYYLIALLSGMGGFSLLIFWIERLTMRE